MNKPPKTNQEYNWNVFDTEAYSTQYLSNVLWEDCCLARMAIGALLELCVPLKSLRIGIDVCNGGIFRGPSIIAPFIHDSGQLHWSDYGEPQVTQASRTIANGKRGNLGGWAAGQTHLGECHTAWSGATLRACHLGKAVKQSIFELPPDTYDIGITCFGPESLTEDRREWEQATTTFFRSVKPGHPVIMFYMINSTGYSSPGRSFPATPISQADVSEIARRELKQIQTFAVESVSHGIRPEYEAHSYESMGGIVGLRI